MLYFYFEAQTGAIHLAPPAAPSNYYRYTFDRRHLAKVKMIVERASVTDTGLSYSGDALAWLEANEIDRPGGLIPSPVDPNSAPA